MDIFIDFCTSLLSFPISRFYRARGRSILGLFFGLFLILPACGKKAPPIPLGVEEPARIGDLAVLSNDGTLFLRWSLPTTNTDGSRLQDLIGFRIFRQERSYPFSPCVSCPHSFEPVAEVDVDYPREGRVEGGRVLWEDRRLKPENEYTYYVIAYNSERVPSAESSAVRKLWDVPPAAPEDLQAEVLDRALRLQWKFSGRLLDGTPMSEGPFRLSREDLKNPPLFALKLWGREDSLHQWLWEKLSAETRRLVEEYDFSDPLPSSFEPIGDRMVEDLNEILKDPSFPEEAPFGAVSFSPPVQKMMTRKKPGEDPIRLNRRLLEEALPRHVLKHRSEMGGFNVYRRGEGERFSLSPLNPEPIMDDQFLDGNLENGRKYIYAVHAIRNFHGSFIESPGSKEITGIPEKGTIPVPPTGVLASRTPKGVDLRWNRNPEPDVAGYDLYRQEQGQGEFKKINASAVTDSYFLDVTAEPQKSYRYRLKAIDRSAPPKESDFSLEVECPPAP